MSKTATYSVYNHWQNVTKYLYSCTFLITKLFYLNISILCPYKLQYTVEAKIVLSFYSMYLKTHYFVDFMPHQGRRSELLNTHICICSQILQHKYKTPENIRGEIAAVQKMIRYPCEN